jgi:hypothetical protein
LTQKNERDEMGHGLCRYCVSLLLDTDGEVEMPPQWTLRVLDVDKQNFFMNTMQVKDFEDDKRCVPNPYMHTHIEKHACLRIGLHIRLFCSFITAVLTSSRIASDNHSSLNTWEKYFLAMQMALENGDVNVERIDDVRTLNTHVH